MINTDLFSLKQKDVFNKILTDDCFINILEGSVRSGKTYSSMLAWVLFMLKSPHNDFLMSGESTDSLYRNVISDLIELLGGSHAKYLNGTKGGAKLVISYAGLEKICWCKGSSKANDEGKIRGMTIGGWYADEITLHHESFVKQAINRMSLKGAKAIWTTNPDSPFHYIKTEFIDQAKNKKYNHWHFNLDDNLTLTENYKENIKAAYSGMWYDRMIEGLWVLADGIIYDMFDKNKHIVPTIERPYSKCYCSIDYGTQNPTAFGLFGLCDGIWHKVKEYHHSGREGNGQKTDSEYADDLEKFLNRNKKIRVIVDPSAASFIAELKKRHFYVIKAKNDVLDGIRNVSTCLKNNKILFNDCCVHTFKEFNSYIWDEKASLKGEDKPIKENDHHMDNLRYFVNTIIITNRKVKAGLRII